MDLWELRRGRMHRLTGTALALLLAIIAFAPVASASELLMFRRAGCPWCATWDREVGPIYGRTEVGRNIPIRFVELGRAGDMQVALASPVRFTPTFVLVEDGREVGRIEGYPGADFFWGLLEGLLQSPASKAGASAPRAGNNS
jgi:hypothetical protein